MYFEYRPLPSQLSYPDGLDQNKLLTHTHTAADLRIDDRGTTKKIYDLVSYWSWKVRERQTPTLPLPSLSCDTKHTTHNTTTSQVIAAHVKDTGEQARLCRQFALAYLSRIWPDALQDGAWSSLLSDCLLFYEAETDQLNWIQSWQLSSDAILICLLLSLYRQLKHTAPRGTSVCISSDPPRPAAAERLFVQVCAAFCFRQ